MGYNLTNHIVIPKKIESFVFKNILIIFSKNLKIILQIEKKVLSLRPRF